MGWRTEIQGGEIQWGGVFSTTLSQGKFDEGASSNDNMRGVNLYGKLSLDNGIRLSGYSGLHYTDYSLTDLDKTERSKRFGYIADLSVGYEWKGGWKVKVEPEAGMTLYGLPSGQYRLDGKMKVKLVLKKRVHFFIDGLDLLSVANKTEGHGRSVTASELRWLYRHRYLPDVQDNLIFWKNYKKVSLEYVFSLPLWSAYRPKKIYQ